MTNKENQNARNREKWLCSQKEWKDMSGEMWWCKDCMYQNGKCCMASQEKKDKEFLCAKNYNRIKRIK